MKEPVVLYTLDRLEYSQEILLYKEPKEFYACAFFFTNIKSGAII